MLGLSAAMELVVLTFLQDDGGDKLLVADAVMQFHLVSATGKSHETGIFPLHCGRTVFVIFRARIRIMRNV